MRISILSAMLLLASCGIEQTYSESSTASTMAHPCQSDSDCVGESEFCALGGFCTKACDDCHNQCGEGFVCKYEVCFKTCRTDADCQAGTLCGEMANPDLVDVFFGCI